MKVEVAFGKTMKSYEVIEQPVPHILVETRKNIVHGWYHPYFPNGKRECSSERILLNPYNGCTVNCPMCYAREYGGYFELWDKRGIVTVFDGFSQKLAEQLSLLYGAGCGYLSPITEPFQKPLENIYRNSEKTAYTLLDYNLPVEFVTKQGDNVPARLLKRMAEQNKHSFCQFTILSVDEKVRKVFSPNGSSVEGQLKALRKALDEGLFAAVRMDPLFPGVTDSEKAVAELVSACKKEGCTHFIFSLCDIPMRKFQSLQNIVRTEFPEALSCWQTVYRFQNTVGKYVLPDIKYAKQVFSEVRKICDRFGVTMSLCMEFERIRTKNGIRYRGLNADYMTSTVCEGMETPIYYRTSLSKLFQPLEKCNGNCLNCAKKLQTPVCGEPLLALAKNLKFNDYLKLKPKPMQPFANAFSAKK